MNNKIPNIADNENPIIEISELLEYIILEPIIIAHIIIAKNKLDNECLKSLNNSCVLFISKFSLA